MKLLDQLLEERAETGDSMTAICDVAATEERDLTDTENENLKSLHSRSETLDTRITELRDIQLANAEAAKMRAEVTTTPEVAERATEVRVGEEPLTYSQHASTSFSVTSTPRRFTTTLLRLAACRATAQKWK